MSIGTADCCYCGGDIIFSAKTDSEMRRMLELFGSTPLYQYSSYTSSEVTHGKVTDAWEASLTLAEHGSSNLWAMSRLIDP